MPDWLNGAFETDAEISLRILIARQAMAFLIGCVIAYIYWLTQAAGRAPKSRGRDARDQTLMMMATLVLLTVLIGMIGSVVGNNVARAFSLVGALSIVRFRTVVEDTRDTAFVIFAVAVGMAIGAGYFKVPLVGLPFVALAALLFRPRGRAAEPTASVASMGEQWLATVRVGIGFAGESELQTVLTAHTSRVALTEMLTSRQGSAIDRTYRVTLRGAESVPVLVGALNALQGVQQVDVRLAD